MPQSDPTNFMSPEEFHWLLAAAMRQEQLVVLCEEELEVLADEWYALATACFRAARPEGKLIRKVPPNYDLKPGKAPWPPEPDEPVSPAALPADPATAPQSLSARFSRHPPHPRAGGPRAARACRGTAVPTTASSR